MSTEITIFEIPEKEISTSKSQKEMEYDDLRRASKLPSYHFDSFYDIELRNEMNSVPKSNIVSILCKYVIKYCMPITKSHDVKYDIVLQNEYITKLLDVSTGKYQAVPSNIQFNVVGLRIPMVFVEKYDSHMLSTFDHISNIDLINTGKWGLRDNQTNKFTAQRDGFTHPGLPPIKTEPGNLVFFNSEDDAQTKLNIIITYIKYMEKYYYNNFLTLISDTKTDPYLPQFDNNGMLPWKIKTDNKYKDVLESMKSAIYGKLGKPFDVGIFMTLQQNNLMRAYNIGSIIGIGNKVFKSELITQKDVLEYKIDFDKQRMLGISKQLESSKKRAISFNKYGVSHLTELDKKQLSVVELEYKKTELALSKGISLKGKENQKLWYHLSKSFLDVTDDRLKAAIIAIERSIPKDQTLGNSLIEGGVCPHVYKKGKVSLKDFGKPWLQDNLKKEIVQHYSLPGTTDGYFCGICGEQLAEADNEGIASFIGGERVSNNMIDDPVQTMIWKESMYIISTYIKFNTPIPVKALVSSIAKGLRNVISEQEAKLFRSRTNTADSIKDTLNIYSCIYVYAVICAMMLTNPNKMMFGRDKPEVRTDRRDKGFKDTSNKEDPLKPPGESSLVEDTLKPPGESSLVKSNNKSRIGAADNNRRIARKNRRTYRGGKTTKDIKLYERFILTTALNLIMVTKDSTIKRLTYMNSEVVKQIFLKTAYPWAKKYSRPIKVNKQDQQLADKTQNIIDMDPFYEYLYYAKRLAYNSGSDKHYPSSIGDVHAVLGRSIDEVAAEMKLGTSLYSTVKVPPKWDFNDELYDSYTYESFQSVYKYLHEELYLKNFVPRHPQVSEYYEYNKKMTDLQDKIFIRYDKLKTRSMFQIQMVNDITMMFGDFSPSKLDLAKFYCPSGTKHKIGKYVYKTKTGDVELDNKTIESWVTKKDVQNLAKFTTYKLVNEKCSLCNKLIRSASSSEKSDTALYTMFNKKDNISAFYQYYASRCPEDGLHDIVNEKCKKCKLDTSVVHNTDDEYYKKYIDVFKKAENEKQAVSINSLNQAQEENKESTTYAENIKYDKSSQTYKYTLQKSAEWSQISKQKYNAIVNIGLSENIKYDDIVNSKVNPSKEEMPPGIYVNQGMKIKSYIMEVLRNYNMMMKHDNNVDIYNNLKEILTAQTKIDIKSLQKSMPQFKNEFLLLDDKYKYSLKPVNYANFLLEYLASIFITINEKSLTKYKLMANMLITYFTNNIIKQERLYGKAESVFSKKQKESIKEDNLTDDGASGNSDYQNDQSADEFSDVDKDVDYQAEDIQSFANAYDVENAGDVWDID
jgi:hypothetical protein